ncbi:hypothetical protein KI811_05325 [Geobacter hydrogenophilus]|nr:hypothetical protein [Geobacter hydrogenophilus]MBT0893235.1 hypothetical protein [Geobacter hydrogenophilus]
MALEAAGRRHELAEAGRTRLAAAQMKNGSVPVSSEAPDAFWPTSLAVLAWNDSTSYQQNQNQAIEFLLQTGNKRLKDSPTKRGWPWTAGTHLWVVPTSLAIMALSSAGHGGHKRIGEGVDVLMSLQLPGGGWNCGSTVVFDQVQLPQADCTGVALAALAGHVPKERVQKSLDYLAAQVSRIRSPLSLGWGIIGLGAWGVTQPAIADVVAESCQLQQKYGPYDTSLLSLLMVVLATNGNPAGMFSSEGDRRGAA